MREECRDLLGPLTPTLHGATFSPPSKLRVGPPEKLHQKVSGNQVQRRAVSEALESEQREGRTSVPDSNSTSCLSTLLQEKLNTIREQTYLYRNLGIPDEEVG